MSRSSHRGFRQILVVDDDWWVLRLLEDTLTKAGYSVLTCLDPLDALNACEVHGVGLVIADWHMPGFTGLEVLEVLQQKYPRIRRALVTAAPNEPEVREAVASGLVQFLVEKPWGRRDLLEAVGAALYRPP